MDGVLDSTGTAPASQDSQVPARVERTWLFVGDFLFYLRLLARQFAHLAKAQGMAHKSMVIVPEIGMAWDQVSEGKSEVMIVDCAESTETYLEFLRELSSRHPEVRRILVSANLSRQMESDLMGAGAHLCFAKPRNLEEAASMFALVNSLVGSQGFLPSGNFKGLAPARFIQFLCARNESGRIAMETEEGEGMLMLRDGKIVDASFGLLNGDTAAAKILSLARTNRCQFRHMETSQYHTVRLNTHQLWIDSQKVTSDASTPPVVRPTPTAKSIRETISSLESLENLSLNVLVDSDVEVNGGDGEAAKAAIILESSPAEKPAQPAPSRPISALERGPSFGASVSGSEEVIIDSQRKVILQRNCNNAVLRGELLWFLRSKGVDVARRLGKGGLISLRSEENGVYWEVDFTAERSVFRMTGSKATRPGPSAPSRPAPMPAAAIEKLAVLRSSAPVYIAGYHDRLAGKAWSLGKIGHLIEENTVDGLMFAFAACLPSLELHHLPRSRMLWEFEHGKVLTLSVGASGLLLGASEMSAPIQTILLVMDRLQADLENFVA